MEIIRSISGLRFTLDKIPNENPNLIEKYANLEKTNLIEKYVNAFHLYVPKGNIVLARDGRPSGMKITELIINELLRYGRRLKLLEIVPMPTLQMFIANHKVGGGIYVTASHNPDNWNGLKFLNSDGTFLDKEECEKFWGYLNDKLYVEYDNTTCEIKIHDKAITQHINKLLSRRYISAKINIIKKYLQDNNIKFVIDAVNSAGSIAVPMLLDRFDCKYEKLYCECNGIFPHNPEPLSQNLTDISNFIKEKYKLGERYIGIATDPDADRLVLIDEEGNCVSEEKTICIAIDSYYTLKTNSLSDVVVNQSTTMLAEWIAGKHNKKVYRSAVGEINVVKLMKDNNAAIGGEGSGGVILPDCHYGRDALVGITLLLCLLSKKNISLKELISSYPNYMMLKRKYDFKGDKEKLYSRVKSANIGASISEIDGIKIYYDKGWAHIRTSNTEPIVRIIAEAENTELAEMYLTNVEKLI
jgi:phosphomannomutase